MCGTPRDLPPRDFAAQGNTVVVGRKSEFSLYDNKISSFEDDGGAYDQKDAAGFIKLQVRLKHAAPLCPPQMCRGRVHFTQSAALAC